MRWDPQDAAEYARRWGDLSLEGASAVWGANLLAAEALPVFGAYPVRGGWLRTTGFRKEGEWPEFSWPIWNQWAGLDVLGGGRCVSESGWEYRRLGAAGKGNPLVERSEGKGV